MLNHLSLRNNVAGSVLVMGVLGILLAVLIAETNREYAIENQRAGFEQIIGLRAETLLDELAKVSHDLGQALQGDKKFRALFKEKNAHALDEHLQSQFHQYFVTAGIIKLESLAVYDNQFKLFSRAVSEGASVDAACPDLHERAAKRTGAIRLKTIAEMCLVDGKPYHSMLLPIGGLRVKGYLEVVTDPMYSLQAIESNLGMPLWIRSVNGKTAYKSQQWPNEDQEQQIEVANYHPLTEKGEQAFTLSMLIDVSEFESRLETVRNTYVTIVIVISLLLSAMMISILNVTALAPLKRLGEQLRNIRRDKKQLGKSVAVSGNREVSELAEGFNEMTDELKTLYDTLLSRNDELSLEVDIRERAEKELKKHRDHLEDLVEQRTQDLASARDAALDASRSKSLFLANMSHELRTPLNAIIGYSEMMIEEFEANGEADRVADLEKVHSAGKHLLSLINEILDLTKIEAGRMDLYEEWFDIRSMLDAVTDMVRPFYLKNNNKFELVCPDDIGDLYADLTKLRQSLYNLLSNAVKFAPGGNIVLTVHREGAGDQQKIIFSVRDDGIGISQEQQDKLFEAFAQADPSTTRKFGGTGLGLVISQHFCNMMGGDIKIVSAQGQGSTFTITLPVKKAPKFLEENQAGAADVAWQASAVAEGKRFTEMESREEKNRRGKISTVLVIDDDPSVRKVMTHFLTQKGFAVKVAVSGDEGLKLARETKPDVITLDVMLPGQDGWDVLRALKHDPEVSAIPVVLITMVENRGLGYSLGAVEYLSKPIDKDRLLSVVCRCVRHSSQGSLLIVENDAKIRNSLQDVLLTDGWNVEAVSSAESAFSQIGHQPPSLIVLNMMMPTMNGFEFLSQLRHDPRWHDIVVIIISDNKLSLGEMERMQAQDVAVINKAEFEHDDLIRKIQNMIEQKLSVTKT